MTRTEEQRVLMAAAGASLAVVVAAAGWVAWRHTGPDREAARVPAMTAVGDGGGDISPILAWAPFGGAVGGPTTLTGLTLKATFMAPSSSASTALIAVNDAPAEAFSPGQAVGGAVLESVAMDHVVMRVGSRVETLAFPRIEAGGSRPATPPAAPVMAASSSAGAAPPSPSATPAGSSTPAAPSSSPGAAPAPGAANAAGPSIVDQFRRRGTGEAPAAAPTRPARPLPPLQNPSAGRDARPGE